jgi:hypothetical protein
MYPSGELVNGPRFEPSSITAQEEYLLSSSTLPIDSWPVPVSKRKTVPSITIMAKRDVMPCISSFLSKSTN